MPTTPPTTTPTTPPTTTPVGQRFLGGWRRLRQRRVVAWTMDLAVIGVLFVAISSWQARRLPEGTPPPLDLAALDGGHVSLESLRGKPALVVFWAPWCGVCGAEADNLARVQRWVGDRARVVTVAAEYDNLGEVQRFVDRHEIALPVGLGGKRVARDWRVSAFPTAFVLDDEGQITRRIVGYSSTAGMALRLLFP